MSTIISGQPHDRMKPKPPSSTIKPTPEPWEITSDEIEILPNSIVGEGYFGVVYKARWREMTVCAKKLKNVRSGEFVNFTKEVQLCSQIRHPHLVQFLAACTQKSNLCIVTEWMSGGSLYGWIHEKNIINGIKYSRTDYSTLLRIAREISQAMIYLHTSKIIHRDLTTSNILLDEHLTTKIGDFGLSRPSSSGTDQQSISSMGGNLYYLAPESFLLQQFTEASDCYAFGIILNELMTGTQPFKGVSAPLAASEAANRGARPTLSSSTPVGIVRLIVACWTHDPAQRPSFRQVLQTLEELIQEIAAEEEDGHTTTSNTSSTTSTQSSNTTSSKSNSSGHKTSGDGKNGKMKKMKLKRATSSEDNNLISTSTPSTPSSSGMNTPTSTKSKPKSKTTVAASSINMAASATKFDPYDQPLQSYGNTEQNSEEDSNTQLSTNDDTTSNTNNKLPIPIISPDSSVTPKDVRLFLVCLKKHMPTHDAFILHKPTLSGIDIFCDPSNYRKGASNKTTSASSSTNANSSAGIQGLISTNGTLRSRSEGDTTGSDDAQLKPRSHQCSPTFISSMYPVKFPAIGELVICRAKRCEESFAQYELCEYTQPQLLGVAAVEELTKRKMRSISKLVTVGQLDVLRVLHIDSERGFVDLSKKDVTDSLRSQTLTYYQSANAAHKCILASARALGQCSYCLYFHVIWPLADRYQSSVYQLLRLSLVNPVMTLGEFRDCSCLQKIHASLTSSVAQSTTTPLLQILTSPRVLPEIARRCEFQRVHLNLSRLALNQFPKQLLPPTPHSSTQPPVANEEGLNSTLDTTEEGIETTPSKRRNNRSQSSSSATNSRRSSATSGGNEKSSSDKSLISSLRSLNVEENPLRTLPDSIGAFRKMQELNVNNCQLSDLPMSLVQCGNLQRLYAFGNQFQKIPTVIRQLLQLTQLNLSSNAITNVAVGELNGLTQLLELSLAHNQLGTILPGTLPTSLQTLDLSYNRFQRFPLAIFEATNIVSLELKHNQIDLIPSPPANAGGAADSTHPLQYLEWLDVSHNVITSVHDALFTSCMYVTWINLSHNQLTSIPQSLFNLIKNKSLAPPVEESKVPMDLETNGTTSSSTQLTGPVGLLYLNLQFNQLKSCTTIANWTNLTSNIPQFLFDDAAVPNSKHPLPDKKQNGSLSVPSTTITLSSPPATPVLSSATTPVPAPPLMHQWTVDEVVNWLNSESFGEFADAFKENLITGATLVELDKSDLRELGVKQLGTQKKILKLIQTHKDQIQAAALLQVSATPTPNSHSVQASPFLHAQPSLPTSASDLHISTLSLGPSCDAPPSVAVRRANSSLSPSTSMTGIATSLLATTAGGTATNCDLRSCERVKSTVLRSALMSETLGKPVLLRCVVVLLIGNVYSIDDARTSLDHAVEAGRVASLASGGVASGPFSGLSNGPRSQLSIQPLILPLFLLSLPCLIPSEGITLIETTIGAMSRALGELGHGGRAKVCIRPYIVDVLPTETFGNANPAPTSTKLPIEGSPSTPSAVDSVLPSSLLHRTKSSGGPTAVSGEILSALQQFTSMKQVEEAEKATKREEHLKKKADKRAADAVEKEKKKKKKAEKTAAAAATNVEHTEEGKPSPTVD